MSDPYTLCVILAVKPEHAEEFATLVKHNVAATRHDQGVVTFHYHRVADSTTWLLYEIWDSKAASDTHQQKPDVQAFFAQAPRMLAAAPQILQLGPVIR